MGDAGVRTVVEEALALALEGCPDESLELLDGLSGGEADLTRARILLHAGRFDRARVILDRLVGGDNADSWRAALSRARRERANGRYERAAELLGRALDRFTRHPPQQAAVLTPLISREVGKVTARSPIDSAITVPDKKESTTDALQTAELLRLVELGRRLALETDPQEVLGLVLREAVALAGARRGFLVRVRGDDLNFVAAVEMDRSEIEQPALEVSRALIREVRRTARIEQFSVADLPADHPASKSLRAIGVHQVICVPIQVDSSVEGVLYLDGAGRSSIQLLELFSRQAAAALGSAEEHQRTTQALETAEEALRRHEQQEQHPGYEEIVGKSRAMQRVYGQLDRVIPTEESVLITGETGTGKDLVARLIHARGPRASRRFVAVNCASLSETLLESELFGHERGAFTGADRARAGLFELADRGTLFLDEVGDMSARMQADLLRVLQSGEVRRVGARQVSHVSVRIIAATHRDLEERIRQGQFREDLYYRLNVHSVPLPALRQRPEDISELIDHLKPELQISSEAMQRLAAYHWPGNVRELDNVLRRITASGPSKVRVRDLPTEVVRSDATPQAGTLRQAESEAIRRALRSSGGNKAKAARILGINRATLYAKLKDTSDPPC